VWRKRAACALQGTSFPDGPMEYSQRGFESKTKSGGSQQRLLAFGVRIGAEIGAIHCGTVESVAECKIVEIANINAVFMDVDEKMVASQKRLGEYPHPLRHFPSRSKSDFCTKTGHLCPAIVKLCR